MNVQAKVAAEDLTVVKSVVAFPHPSSETVEPTWCWSQDYGVLSIGKDRQPLPRPVLLTLRLKSCEGQQKIPED